jgi:acyl-CoA reductase-like NAD-dependent aldehyde dehydrogenase
VARAIEQKEPAVLIYDNLFIGGSWNPPEKPELIDVLSPHDGSVVGRTPHATPADVDRAVAAARAAFEAGPWPRMSPVDRVSVIARFAALHAARGAELAALVPIENGTPRWYNDWMHTAGGIAEQTGAYLRAAESFEWERRVPQASGAVTVMLREPVGVVAAIIPWNSPHQSALAKMVPALLAGCPVILKAAPETAVDAMVLAELFEQAQLPAGVVTVLVADREVSEYLVRHPGIEKVAFTGSTAVGRRIASIAGEQLKRVSLELGGKSAAILLPDANVAAAAAGLQMLGLANNGESCVAHTRILAPRERYDEVVQALEAMVQNVRVGDPSDPANFVGPMVREDQQRRVREYIELGVREGARIVAGGSSMPDGLDRGWYIRPTLFDGVDNSMRIAQEEIFGPVLAVIPYDTEQEAVAIANDSPYGLGGGVWSADPDRGEAVAREIRSGFLVVNGAPVGFDGAFGGYKASGIGREFGAVGLGQNVEHKTITR